LEGYKATISVSGQTASVDDLTFDDDNTATVTVLAGKFPAVVDSTVADVTISKGTAGQQGYEEYKITSAPFAIGAAIKGATVAIDGNKTAFISGETIKVKVTLYYDTDKTKVLTTEDDTAYAAVVGFGAADNQFNRTLKFNKGVAEVEIPAYKAVSNEALVVAVSGTAKFTGIEMKTAANITIKHGAATQLKVTPKDGNTKFDLAVLDAAGNSVNSFTGVRDVIVTATAKPKGAKSSADVDPSIPDPEGKATVTFSSNGKATINIKESPYFDNLAAGNYIVTVKIDGTDLVGQVEYTKQSKPSAGV
jgi:hypothetical protein